MGDEGWTRFNDQFREDEDERNDRLSRKRFHRFKPGDRVVIVGNHPHREAIAKLIVYENYALNLHGWRATREDGHGEFYVNPAEIRLVPIR